MTQLPNLLRPRVEVPMSTSTIHSRALYNPNTVRGTFPKPNRPAAQNPTAEYKTLTRGEHISAESRVDDILKGAPLTSIPLENVNQVIITLKERKRQATLAGNYHLSQQIVDLIQKINSIVIQRKHAQMKSQEIKALEIQLQQAENSLKKTIEQWNQKVTDFNRTQSSSARRLERTQLTRLQDNDSRPIDELPSSYLKPSPALLDLRERERHLVLTKRYDEATALHKEGNKMEKIEELEKKRIFLQTQKRQRQQLLAAQDRDVAGFKERWMRSADKLNQTMDAEVAQQQKIVDNIRKKLEDAKKEAL
ncbi:hypothetical protein TVAG_165330 [Trichomonas vaginalis G3]|uniref:Uncharacterized protein n=1 Tax=Trichomonas vaginalis (strain ATCC PRA-98 / G3) TaxID=412133 RepID=A2DUL4_TRIV3|nr:hypothetical protein TVAGG3_0662930 [Trichomonas vaginalis G3]EAY15905.1 hypothetical protein TVAG_165330 [Trichomonas vaginalis G3]KAI5506634.1 hypothetical protein TVAGG3_0662930 [Trichomonas vaginalis G3]|eukprot:XP_001328128.1 hypothetical protein [Trichomonas vaginalis G3]